VDWKALDVVHLNAVAIDVGDTERWHREPQILSPTKTAQKLGIK
jgi:hypothetical protein